MHRFFLEKNKLIRQVNADVKTLLRYFPGVSDDLTTTTRSLVEMKSVLYGCMNEIKDIRTDVALIKFHTMYLPRNLTRLSHILEIRDRIILQRMNNGTETLNNYYGKMRKDHRKIRRDLRKLTEFVGNMSVEMSCPAGAQPDGQVTPQSDFVVTPYPDATVDPHPDAPGAPQPSDLPAGHHPVHPPTFSPTIERQLSTLIFGQEQIKNKIDEGMAKLEASIAHLERKLELAFADLNEDTKLIHERVVSDIAKVMQQISELKGMMTSTTSQPPPTSQSGIKFTAFRPRQPHSQRRPLNLSLPNITPRLTLAQIFKFWSVIKSAREIFHRIREKKPVVGLGGAIGIGKLIEVPEGFPDYSGLMGGISGLAMIPNEELNNLGNLLLELPGIFGIPLPPLSELPNWLVDNAGKPIGTPRPAMPGLDDTIEPTVLPTEDPESWLPWLIPEPTASPDAFPETVEHPEIVDLEPDLPIPPAPKPTLPAAPEIPHLPEIVPEPTKPTVLQPEAIPDIYPTQATQPPTAPPTPSAPEPPTLLEPITVLKAAGFENHCACSCPCDCTCPILPIEFPKTTSIQWWTKFHESRPRSNAPQCKCLCACPCPPQHTTKSPHAVMTEDEMDTERPPWSLQEDDPPHYYDDTMTTDHWQPPISESPTSDGKDDHCATKIDDLSSEIRELSDDFQMLKMTVRDEMVITREAIMTQMNEKFLAVSAALAGTHYTNVLLHSNDKNATDYIGEMMKGQFTRTYYTLRGVTEAVNRMRAAVQTMLRAHYNGMMNPEPLYYNPYWQMRYRHRGIRDPLFRRSSPAESARESSLPTGFHGEKL
ncbi:uncharacterized protein LOC107048560 [Diachasma alloeum]|uniref:uncharacterized protein LOC107048560 n=1 Tax=Diachasma alloeum TaxID=454923 RepID=UPI0007382C13|nr:uncharacterized protein LOC107048560 [Diachasma alloeum]